ncbi:UNVERIFIED_CONTAM: hypothetical protein GTU68_041408 [Idotea baltica]|nr:hypothetical protein [Idotea baltica]
MFIQINSEK